MYLVHMVPRGSGKELGLMVWVRSKGLGIIRHVLGSLRCLVGIGFN